VTLSDLVNSHKTDDARCIEPVAIDRGFFDRQLVGDETRLPGQGLGTFSSFERQSGWVHL